MIKLIIFTLSLFLALQPITSTVEAKPRIVKPYRMPQRKGRRPRPNRKASKAVVKATVAAVGVSVIKSGGRGHVGQTD